MPERCGEAGWACMNIFTRYSCYTCWFVTLRDACMKLITKVSLISVEDWFTSLQNGNKELAKERSNEMKIIYQKDFS